MVKHFKEKSVKIPVNPFYHHFSLSLCIPHKIRAAPIPEAIPLIYSVIPRGLGERVRVACVYGWCGVVGAIGGKTFLHFCVHILSSIIYTVPVACSSSASY